MSVTNGNAFGESSISEDPRMQRGTQIAALSRVTLDGDHWVVPSQTGEGRYKVFPDEGRCTCPDYETRSLRCKHQWAVEFVRQREVAPDGTETVTEAVRVTYTQQWSSYNAAQTNEHDRFLPLLR